MRKLDINGLEFSKIQDSWCDSLFAIIRKIGSEFVITIIDSDYESLEWHYFGDTESEAWDNFRAEFGRNARF